MNVSRDRAGLSILIPVVFGALFFVLGGGQLLGWWSGIPMVVCGVGFVGALAFIVQGASRRRGPAVSTERGSMSSLRSRRAVAADLLSPTVGTIAGLMLLLGGITLGIAIGPAVALTVAVGMRRAGLVGPQTLFRETSALAAMAVSVALTLVLVFVVRQVV
jgi:hypothetical protein